MLVWVLLRVFAQGFVLGAGARRNAEAPQRRVCAKMMEREITSPFQRL